MESDSDNEFPDLIDLEKQIKAIAQQKKLQTKKISGGASITAQSDSFSKKAIAEETLTRNNSINTKGQILNSFPDGQISIPVSRNISKSKKSYSSSHDSFAPVSRECNLFGPYGPNSTKSDNLLEKERASKKPHEQEREILPRKTSEKKKFENIVSDTKQTSKINSNARNKHTLNPQQSNNTGKSQQFDGETQIMGLDYQGLIQQGYILEEDFWSSTSDTESSVKRGQKFNIFRPGKEKYQSQSPQNSRLRPTNLSSPKKIHRIPTMPHEKSTDAFWQQDIINKWNDECSPPKKIAPSFRPSGEQYKSIKSKPNQDLSKTSTKLGLKSKEARRKFSENKQSLAESFFFQLDREITQGEISRMAASTGGVKIEWSKKLNSTAGRANWRREAIKPATKTSDGGYTSVLYKHFATIELAEKVIDDEDRLLNVMAHEFCHLANFMISGIRNNPHGKEFKSWAAKCTQKFGHRGIHVTTKHSYAIDYKYIWRCEECGSEVKRHSKSVNLARHRCGTCRGQLVQIKPAPRLSTKSCEYQTFVRENMKNIRQENPGSPQKEIMSLVGKRYQEQKALQTKEENKNEKNKKNREIFTAGEFDTDLIAQQLSNIFL
ncbi:putative sprt family metallopeptidase [Golovinomyces cichoracearum]|uniref:Putative sprt family metallopeptidase n=1 Tax=Golovinomyces cichoracearum TaxID=62708 RepID=A0A420J760_9PEZI|nr:putative sprt family metallopeptidase [Golovinomyces cichoracearum]